MSRHNRADVHAGSLTPLTARQAEGEEMSKRQIWLTMEERDLARRICQYAKERCDHVLTGTPTAVSVCALRWTHISISRLELKFAELTAAELMEEPAK